MERKRHGLLVFFLKSSISGLRMRATTLLVYLGALTSLKITNAKIREIPIPDELQECYDRVYNYNADSYVGSIYNWFCEHFLINSTNSNDQAPVDAKTTRYLRSLMEETAFGSGQSSVQSSEEGEYRKKRQTPTTPCRRREYRMLTSAERTAFHNAINTLKRDTSATPNAYDAIANIHTGNTNLIAHGGPGFLGWHRFYILMYENALRRVNPNICLPYWDSTLDNQLPNPFQSSIWTPAFLGTARGPVISGPFANWRRPNGAQLMRNAAVDGELLSRATVEDVLTRTRYEDIVASPTVNPRYDLERAHGSVHIYCGGDMSLLNTAAYDPVFFLHHAFIDFWFEQFRARLRSLNRDPTVYPAVTVNTRHRATAPTGFGSTQAEGYSNTLAARATYEPVPTCSAQSPSCGAGSSLVCNTATGRCLPTTTTGVGKRAARYPNPSSGETCDRPTTYALPNQNSFCSGQTCDTDQWAMIPVKIVSVRPPKFGQYNSFPVRAGQVDTRLDIYSPSAYNNTKKFIINGQGNPKTYSRCDQDSPVGQIFLYSHGMNYAGYYKESTIIDQKLPVSSSMGFIGVRRPTAGGVSNALLRAHDSCGRVCHVACRDPYTNEFKSCSGAVSLSDEKPLMYGNNLDDAVMSVFDYNFDAECPRIQTENFYITFFCDYRNKFPFSKPRQVASSPR